MMESLHEHMHELRKQLEKGEIQKAYQGLMEYILRLRTYFTNKYPDFYVSGIYPGYMDMTYFSFTPEPFRQKKLRVAIVFVYDTFRFEIWLAGYNKQIQAQYWKMFKDSGWDSFPLVPATKGEDAIIRHALVSQPDFRDPEVLTDQIERETLKFIDVVTEFLSTR